jgi:hypothetical protein
MISESGSRCKRTFHLRLTGVGSSAVTATLVITSGEREGEQFELVEDTILGRVDADVTLDDVEVTRQHALIRIRATGADIADLGSTNGTFVDGKRLEQRAKLSNGSVIRVGQTELRFVQGVEEDQGTRVSAPGKQPVVLPEPRVEVVPPPPAAPLAAPVARAAASDIPAPFTVRQRRAPHRGVASRQPAMVVFTLASILATNMGLIAYFWKHG